jgi:hypothetical protein
MKIKYEYNYKKILIYILIITLLSSSLIIVKHSIKKEEPLTKETHLLKKAPEEWPPGFPRTAIAHVKSTYTDEEIEKIARFDIFSAGTKVSLKQLQTLKNLNPNIKIIPRLEGLCGILTNDYWEYYDYSYCWDPSTPWVYENRFYLCELWNWTYNQDCWLYREDNQHFLSWSDNYHWAISLTPFCSADNEGRRISHFIADMLNQIVYQNSKNIEKINYWDGLYLDCGDSIYWWTIFNNNLKPDANLDGIGDSQKEFDEWWESEGEILFGRLRQHIGQDGFVMINGQKWWRNYLNGFFLEHTLQRQLSSRFNNDKEAQWQWTMFDPEKGYLSSQQDYLTQPFTAFIIHVSWQCGTDLEPQSCDQTTRSLTEFHKAKRFALGSVLLGDGFISFNKNTLSNPETHEQTWWLPEYDNGIENNQHYLGNALGPCNVVEDDNTLTECRPTDPPKLYRRDFENGIVLVNPSYEEKTINLDAPYKILDVTKYFTAPAGSIVNEITIPPFDSIILLNYQAQPPQDNQTQNNQTQYPPSCEESWSCTEWSSCINNTQTRNCIDINNCNTTLNMPKTSRPCPSDSEPQEKPDLLQEFANLSDIIITISIFIAFIIALTIYEVIKKLFIRKTSY